MRKAVYHLPGLFEFYELYRVFLPLFRETSGLVLRLVSEIGSIYGAPSDCLWGGGTRRRMGSCNPREVLALTARNTAFPPG